MRIVFISSFISSFVLRNARIRLRLTPLRPYGGGRDERPAFDVEYRMAETRLVCVNRDSSSSRSRNVEKYEKEEETGLDLLHDESRDRTDNERVAMKLEVVASKTGIFTLYYVEISLCSGSFSLLLPPSSVSIERKMLMAIVEETEHSIEFPQGK
ncbi:hypothetical protein PFISCL1PPCAC_20768, partial [Pristionchus fissidentatus]